MEVRMELVSTFARRTASTSFAVGRNLRVHLEDAGAASLRASPRAKGIYLSTDGTMIRRIFGQRTDELRTRSQNFSRVRSGFESNTAMKSIDSSVSVAEGKDSLSTPDTRIYNGKAIGKMQSADSDVSVVEGMRSASDADPESGNVDVGGNISDDEELKGYKMSRICDRLIEVFMKEKTTPEQWLDLLLLSKEWIKVRPHFFKRCKRNAKYEQNPVIRRQLVELAKNVKEVDDKMILHDFLLDEIEQNKLDLETLVARRRKDFTSEFFEYLRVLRDCSPKAGRRDEIAGITTMCLSVVEAHDAALEDQEALLDAQVKFDEIIGSSSLQSAAKKIQEMAREKELDSTLFLLITKAWVAAMDSSTIKQETKDIMLYIYRTARKCMQDLAPDEVQIIKYLISIQDPRDRFAALTTVFHAGDELEDRAERRLHTSPPKLLYWLNLILDAYYLNKQSTLIKDARGLTNPTMISRLEVLKEFVTEQFI